jgi:fructokinase
MKHIYCLGETVYDIIFKNDQPVVAKAGGSMLNSTVSMGRIGMPVSFISEYGNDQIGIEIDKFLISSNVDTSHVFKYSDGKTSVAIAFLNERNDASYSFYKQLPEKRFDIVFPKINADDIVLFGSFYSINTEIRSQVVNFISDAKRAGAIVIYDPNFRKAHLHEIAYLLPYITENMQMANIVRGSNEDFQMIFNANLVDEAYQQVSKYCKTLIYTKNSEGVYIKDVDKEIFVETKKLIPVSTIGAGDNFNAGLIYGLFYNNIKTNQLLHLDDSKWEENINYAIDFASEVCMSYDNYISEEFARKYKKTD